MLPKTSFPLLLALLSLTLHQSVSLEDHLAECKITIEKSRVCSKGIPCSVHVKLERKGAGVEGNTSSVTVIETSQNGNSSRNATKELQPVGGLITEFETEITTRSLGRSYYNICSSDCLSCKELVLFSIPAPLTLLPPLLTVLLAIVSRQVLLSLASGIFVAALIASAYNPISAFITTLNTYFIIPFTDPSKAGVVMFVAMIGGVIEIADQSGGANDLTRHIAKVARSPQHAAIVAMILPMFYFFDDFAGIMICGRSLGTMVTTLGLSKQKFSFIVHMMAVIVASLCPLSSWAGIQIGYIESAFKLSGMQVSGFSYLIRSIPYRFFVLTALFSVILYVFINRELAPMLSYEIEAARSKAKKEEETSDIASSIGADELDEKVEDGRKEVKERWFNAIIPLMVLVGVSLLRMYYDGKEAIVESGVDIPITFLNCASHCNSINCLVIGTAVSFLLSLVLIPAQKIMGLAQCMKYFVEGVKSMSEPNMILILAWSLGEAMNDIHTSEYIALALGEGMRVEFFPSLVCIIGYAMSYASGSALGTQGILFPLVVPVVVNLTDNEEIYLRTVAAALSSSVFGNLCSPIADTTIAGVLFTECPMVDHLKVMTSFCLPLAALTILFGDLLVGIAFGTNVYPFYASYIIVLLFVALLFGWWGRKVGPKGDEPSLRQKLMRYLNINPIDERTSLLI